MKKVFALCFAAFLCTTTQAQVNSFSSGISKGADPAALKIQFLPADALILPNGTIQIGVALKARVKNIGTKTYIPGLKPLPVILYQLKRGKYVPVEQMNLKILKSGATDSFNYYTTYIKGQQKPPIFMLAVHSKYKGVPYPDVNMKNNRKKAIAQ